jgi:peptide/nickel transport system substrate-binding protein
MILLLLASATASGPAAPRILRLAWWTDVGILTPFAASTVGPGGVVRLSLISDTLTWKDETGVIPWLAESWRARPDGRAYTFVLRRDVFWHDGRPLSTRDVQFSFEYYRAHPFVWINTGTIEAVTVDGPRTVTVTLRHPFAPFLEDVAGVVPIIPAHIWEGVGHPEQMQTLAAAVGSGPYILADYRPGSGDYRFLANPRYLRGRPRIDEIRYTIVPAERQVLAVQSGQIDAAMTETRDVVRAFAGHPYLRTWQTEPLSIARLLFNLGRPPFDQKVVRQALAHAINRTQLSAVMTRGAGVPGNPGLVSPTDAWYTSGVRTYPYDPVKARTMLAAAGVPALKVELLASPSPAVPLIQEMLGAAGIDATARIVDARTRAGLIAEGRFQVALTFHIGAGGDPDYLRRWFAGDETNQFGQATAFAHPEYQRLADQQARAVDSASRRRLLDRMQQVLAEELPTLALYHRPFFWVYDRRLVTPVSTRGGLMNGIPLIENKLAFLRP